MYSVLQSGKKIGAVNQLYFGKCMCMTKRKKQEKQEIEWYKSILFWRLYVYDKEKEMEKTKKRMV